jgi:hypothetical protein
VDASSATQTPPEPNNELTIGELRDSLPVDVWVPLPGFPGWRIKRLPDDTVIARAS